MGKQELEARRSEIPVPQKGQRRCPGNPAAVAAVVGRVTVFPNWCKGCGLCVALCPVKVLEQDEEGRIVVAYPERCTACRWCELHCPDFALFVSEVEKE